MRDIADALASWRAAGTRFAIATVVRTWRSAPRQPGAAMAVSEHGEVVGSVSGGCVEGAVYDLAMECIASGTSVVQTYGVSDDDADHILGWRIARSGDSEGVLTTSGRLGEPRIIGMTPPGRVVLATLVELNGLTGKALWTPTAPVHRAVAQRVLARLPAMAATAR